MGKAANSIVSFIDSIPDEKLVGFSKPNPSYNVWKDADFRLDVQNMTSDKPQMFNLQIQVNSGTGITTLKKLAKKSKFNGTTVSKALVPVDGSWDAAAVRRALHAGRVT
ncbi:hypothetical protein B0T19DRAFT_100867 [Cercophora scortea]|uniref:Uncharacterized protein n=1 Tax=Cercophora scortea TaxID=314031 RepID=A0AAE0IWN6_9PEZI|nr:hypothetical protein B0T19DRAFT_100867 [Cercophora scortea]